MPTLSDIIPARGAVLPPLTLEYERDLTMNDIARLNLAMPQGPPPIKTVRAIHHRQAMLIAQGKTVAEVARLVGSTETRIHQLEHDPAFSELVHYYKDQCTEIEFDAYRRVQNILVDILELSSTEIVDRLEDPSKRAAVPMGELRKLSEFAADRSIAPPKATASNAIPPMKVELNFGFGTQVTQPSQSVAAPSESPLTIEHDSNSAE